MNVETGLPTAARGAQQVATEKTHQAANRLGALFLHMKEQSLHTIKSNRIIENNPQIVAAIRPGLSAMNSLSTGVSSGLAIAKSAAPDIVARLAAAKGRVCNI